MKVRSILTTLSSRCLLLQQLVWRNCSTKRSSHPGTCLILGSQGLSCPRLLLCNCTLCILKSSCCPLSCCKAAGYVDPKVLEVSQLCLSPGWVVGAWAGLTLQLRRAGSTTPMPGQQQESQAFSAWVECKGDELSAHVWMFLD